MINIINIFLLLASSYIAVSLFVLFEDIIITSVIFFLELIKCKVVDINHLLNFIHVTITYFIYLILSDCIGLIYYILVYV